MQLRMSVHEQHKQYYCPFECSFHFYYHLNAQALRLVLCHFPHREVEALTMTARHFGALVATLTATVSQFFRFGDFLYTLCFII